MANDRRMPNVPGGVIDLSALRNKPASLPTLQPVVINIQLQLVTVSTEMPSYLDRLGRLLNEMMAAGQKEADEIARAAEAERMAPDSPQTVNDALRSLDGQ